MHMTKLQNRFVKMAHKNAMCETYLDAAGMHVVEHSKVSALRRLASMASALHASSKHDKCTHASSKQESGGSKSNFS